MYGVDFESFVGRVCAEDCGAGGYHVEVWVFLEEEAAFEAGVNCSYFDVGVEEVLVCLFCDFEQVGVGVWRPAGVSVGVFDFCTGEGEHGFDGLSGGLFAAFDGRSLGGCHGDLSFIHFDGGEV